MGYTEKGETAAEDFHRNKQSRKPKSNIRAKVRKNGSLPLPAKITRQLGLAPGAKVDIIPENERAIIHPNIHSLARVYIEPTSVCNLTCQTCIRNTWTEPFGYMEMDTFNKLVQQLQKFPHLQSVMFGGFGEPTVHKEISSMIREAKSLGVKVEMVTNGTLLDDQLISRLFDSRLDTLWISFDGVSDISFDGIRKGASFRQVIRSLELLRTMNKKSRHRIDLGIAFVVMKKNIEDLKHLDRLIRETGARMISVSNVLPYTEELEKQMVCSQALTLNNLAHVPGRADIILPRLDLSSITEEAFLSLLKGFYNLAIMGNKIHGETCQCRFIKDRCTFIRWDGKVAPCMGLLHSHITFLYGLRRNIESYSLGDIASEDLFDLWNSREYMRFREKIRAFEFSPCHVCGGCDYLEKNREDCFGNSFPACGGCLWAQGIIQCP